MSSVTAVCPVHGSFPSRPIRKIDRAGAVTIAAANCPTCGRKTAVMEAGYDFSNFAVTKALVLPERTVATLDDLHHHLVDIVTSARESWNPGVVVAMVDALTRKEPALALALRGRTAARPRDEAIDVLEAVIEAVVAMRTAAANGRLSVRLKEAIVHAALP